MIDRGARRTGRPHRTLQGRLGAVVGKWGTLGPDDRRDIEIYGWGLIWLATYALFTPATVLPLIAQPATVAWTSAGGLGAICAIVGVLRHDHLVLERWGLGLLRWTPIVYAVSQLVLLVLELAQTGTSPRWHLIVLAVWPWVFLRKRARYLAFKRREAQTTPLPGES